MHLIHRRNSFRAAPITVQHAKNNEKINFLTPYIVTEICGDGNGVNSLTIKNLDTNKEEKLEVPVIFEFVGYEVNNQILQQQDGSFLCDVDSYGSVVVDLKMHTNLPGLFAAGDIRINAPKQVVCAAGDGAQAALETIAYLEQNH